MHQDIESALDEYRAENYLEKDFTKQPDGSYKFNGRRIILQLLNGVLAVRVGGGYMQLSEFLGFFRFQEHTKTIATDRLRSPQRTVETSPKNTEYFDDVETPKKRDNYWFSSFENKGKK